MIQIEKTEVVGFEHAIRGMRNPMNSWDKRDSTSCYNTACSKCNYFIDSHCTHKTPGCNFAIGPNDPDLMLRLAQGGPVHAKYRRMIVVYADITAPLYWWKEFDTYKVGTVANSCSTMHKIQAKEFTLEDFSHEHLYEKARKVLQETIRHLNWYRELFLTSSSKDDWWQMIQLLPSSYNQKRTVMMNYEVLAGIYPMRKDHKLDEWRIFCDWIKSLPYSELIVEAEAQA